ncbi:MAG: epoxyqueuosine reductase [Desulfobacteraceae bacterium]|nr:epoxyqueuosine reductase [Desulfobacteraceae bacterium]
MSSPLPVAPPWIVKCIQLHKISLWGVADLRALDTPADENGQRFPFAFSWAVPMNPRIMADIRKGPNQAYADEYATVNKDINTFATALAAEIKTRGFRAMALAASERTDKINLKGVFAHKTAATRAGLGWIGRNCQLITRPFGPWVRLGTVFTTMGLPSGPPAGKSFCGNCMRCVEACPAKALKGNAWHPGLPRDAILDATACDRFKKKYFYQYNKGRNCGICAAVCPYGLNTL